MQMRSEVIFSDPVLVDRFRSRFSIGGAPYTTGSIGPVPLLRDVFRLTEWRGLSFAVLTSFFLRECFAPK